MRYEKVGHFAVRRYTAEEQAALRQAAAVWADAAAAARVLRARGIPLSEEAEVAVAVVDTLTGRDGDTPGDPTTDDMRWLRVRLMEATIEDGEGTT